MRIDKSEYQKVLASLQAARIKRLTDMQAAIAERQAALLIVRIRGLAA